MEYYEKALSGEKMDIALQQELYYYYAYCCWEKKKCETANEYINKALDMNPNDSSCQWLYKQIKRCLNKK
jgi:tetratricopeptide (TPR) repeat protein